MFILVDRVRRNLWQRSKTEGNLVEKIPGSGNSYLSEQLKRAVMSSQQGIITEKENLYLRVYHRLFNGVKCMKNFDEILQ